MVLPTDRLKESAAFMRTIGMRPVFEGPEVAILELRGGTHERFRSLGLDPSAIDALPSIDHSLFRIREPAGHVITVYSSHVTGPV